MSVASTETLGRIKTIYVDLDGTLVTCNSFHRWLIFTIMIGEVKYSTKLRIMLICLKRLIGNITHWDMKREVLKIVTPNKEGRRRDDDVRFAKVLFKYLNKDVLGFINLMRKNGAAVIIATAAPSNYSEVLADRLGFDGCLSTFCVGPAGGEWVENIGVNKRNSIMRDMADRCVNKDECAIITDHFDDIPSMSLVSVTVWVGKADRKCLPGQFSAYTIDKQSFNLKM